MESKLDKPVSSEKFKKISKLAKVLINGYTFLCKNKPEGHLIPKIKLNRPMTPEECKQYEIDTLEYNKKFIDKLNQGKNVDEFASVTNKLPKIVIINKLWTDFINNNKISKKQPDVPMIFNQQYGVINRGMLQSYWSAYIEKKKLKDKTKKTVVNISKDPMNDIFNTAFEIYYTDKHRKVVSKETTPYKIKDINPRNKINGVRGIKYTDYMKLVQTFIRPDIKYVPSEEISIQITVFYDF